MNMEKAMVNVSHRNTKELYRVGGVSAIILSISYILITGVYVVGGALPEGAEAWLQFLNGHTAAWWVILGLSVLTDFLFLPVVLALYVALKGVDNTTMLVGAGLVGMFAILDLVVTWPNYSTLIALSGGYATATSEAQRAVIVAAATYAVAVLDSTLFAVYAILVPSVGIFIISLVMLKGRLSKATAYMGVATGVLGVVAVVGPFLVSALGMVAVLASVLTILWVLFAGIWLVRLDER